MTKATEGPKTCFFIAPIGLEGSEERLRSDQVLKHIVAPAAKDCGYDTIRADHISEPGIITSQVIQHVVEDPLVVADLTGRNPNVFYELAIRHAIRKPVVQIIHGSETIPFDVAATRTIHFDHHDLDSSAKAREDITRQIRAVEKNPKDADTPITVALELQQLRQSDNPLEKINAAIIVMLQAILEILQRQERRAEIDEPFWGKPSQKGSVFDIGHAKPRQTKELRNMLATMNFDSVVSEEVAKYLATKTHGGILSSDFLRTIEGKLAEEEKKPKKSQDEGETNET